MDGRQLVTTETFKSYISDVSRFETPCAFVSRTTLDVLRKRHSTVGFHNSTVMIPCFLSLKLQA
jgi:hypothetical protein